MKKITAFIFTVITTATTFAADLYVKEFGGGGAYSTISSAIAAAAHGDRILIEPKAGAGLYIENITIDKNLQLLTAANGAMYYVQGTVTIGTGLPSGSHVVIDGMRLTVGDITAGASTNTINVSLVNNYLGDGSISLGNNIVSTIANNEITYFSTTTNYALDIRKGNVFGNYVTTSAFGIRISSNVSSPDTCFIVGNRVRLAVYHTSGIVGILWANSSQFFYISNNYVNSITNTLASTSAHNYSLIRISAFKSGTNANEFNNLLNNSMNYDLTASTSMTGVGGLTGVFATVALNQSCNIFNNLVQYQESSVTGRSGFNINGTPQFGYNIVNCVTTTSFINIGNATGNSNTRSTVNLALYSYGCPVLTSNALVNAGHPDPIFTDLNLTRNDIGACGGSYNINENYMINGTAGSAKVHWLWTPRRVLQGGLVTIKAEGHDR